MWAVVPLYIYSSTSYLYMQELKYDVAKRMIDEGYGIVDIMGNTGLDETEVHLIQCERSGMTKYSLLHEKEKVEYGNEMAKKAALMEKYSIAQNLLNMGLDIVDIMETIGLTETEILSLKEEQIV